MDFNGSLETWNSSHLGSKRSYECVSRKACTFSQPHWRLFLSPGSRNSLRCWSCDLATQSVCRFIIDETDGVEGGTDFRVRHELLPDQARAVVLDHDHDGSLVEAHIDVLEPVFGLVEAIAETVDAPEFV